MDESNTSATALSSGCIQECQPLKVFDVLPARHSFSSDDSSLIIACNAWNYDETGGAYKIATDFAVYCAAKGWDVHYVSSHRDGGVEHPSIECGVNVWRYTQPKGSGQGKSLRNFKEHLQQTRRVASRISKKFGPNRPLILNGHTPIQYLGLLASIKGSSPLRKVMSVHSPMAKEYLAEINGVKRDAKDYFIIWLLSRIEARCYRKSDLVQCDSYFTRSMLEKDFPLETRDSLVVCPGYVDLQRFALLGMTRIEARQKLSRVWKTSDTIFYCLRRHVARMGIDNLIKACAWVRNELNLTSRRPKFRVIIGGDGPLRKELEKLARDYQLENIIYFTGKVSESELELTYRAADCFVLPTRGLECFGLIILESFAAGTPVIATPVGSIPEVLGRFARESLTEGTGPEEIGKRMLQFIQNNPWRDRERELYEHAQQYDKNIVLARLENIVTGNHDAAR